MKIKALLCRCFRSAQVITALAIFCFPWAQPAFAADVNMQPTANENCDVNGNEAENVTKPCLQPRCYREHNARGEIIKWVKTEQQCRYQSVGRSWGTRSHYVNIYKADLRP